MEYKVIRSDRKNLALQVKNGEVYVKAPKNATDREIERFVEINRNWIESHQNEQLKQKRMDNAKLSKEEIMRLIEYARDVIPQRVEYYAPIVDVTYSKISIKAMRTKWGSCSSNGNLCFNCLLMLAPMDVLDSVVVHELCHRKQMNHSDKFYAEVLKVYPQYYKCHDWLKEHGGALLRNISE
jgi:predicted metal-dependent hydrolase